LCNVRAFLRLDKPQSPVRSLPKRGNAIAVSALPLSDAPVRVAEMTIRHQGAPSLAENNVHATLGKAANLPA
jgi:hypothetical protein